MAEENTRPIRVSNKSYEFLYDIQTNLRVLAKQKGKNRPENLNYPVVLDLIVSYFKNNNKEYLDMLNSYKN